MHYLYNLLYIDVIKPPDSLQKAYILTIVFHTNNRRSHQQNPFHSGGVPRRRMLLPRYPGSAGASMCASETLYEESCESEGDTCRGRRQGVSESALPWPQCTAPDGKSYSSSASNIHKHSKLYGKYFASAALLQRFLIHILREAHHPM